MRTADIIIAVVSLLVAGIVAMQVRDLPFLTEFAPGPSFAPLLVAGAGTILALLLLGNALLRPIEGLAPDEDVEPGARQRVALVMGLVLLQTALIPWLGMTLCIAGFTFVTLAILLRRPLLPSLATTIITAAFIYLIFGVWLQVDMPEGIFGI